MKIIEELEQGYLKKIPEFRVGDTLKVHVKIIEGDKERVQPFTGQVIARKGRGTNASITLRKISYGEGVERVFFLCSPKIARIEIAKREPVRRAKLYYTRAHSGGAA
ncbi:MAG: 50S ribosomal protein L19 [Candidatus Aureabacteria bacterium]|nr:50S ribosomal protein L19 [Candidatus Auribacterota bacterium]